jgi:hypothetical protein
MNTRPILFSSEMVRAILDGRKTETRRVINLLSFEKSGTQGYDFAFRSRSGAWNEVPTSWLIKKYCPYGQPGDHLWVRETFATYLDGYVYKANYANDGFGSQIVNLQTGELFPLVWKPSIHMPRQASRITLEVKNIRVQRVQEISGDECTLEGIEVAWSDPNNSVQEINAFKSLWNVINAKRGYGWDVNPWVWVIEFKVSSPVLVEK